MRYASSLVLVWLGLGCRGPEEDVGVPAIVDPERPEHFFDLPFPSDDLRGADGFPVLAGYPLPAIDPARGLVESWVRRVERAAPGFGNDTPAYFRFAGALDLPETFETDGRPDDPVVWVAIDGSEILPLEGRFVADPLGDPFYGPNTLAVTPALGSPPRSGQTYAVAVMRSSGASPPDGVEPPARAVSALKKAGVTGEIAVATVFTIQDATGMLRQLAADVETRPVGSVSWREVVALEYAQDLTPSGQDATRATTVFADGSREDAWLAPGAVDRVVDLSDWPMVVYQGELQTWSYQGLDGRPWMSPGFGHLVLDFDQMGGWMPFDGYGQLVGAPVPESMRVVLSVPRDGAARGVVLHDHGTGGHAYNIVQRRDIADSGLEVSARFAAAGWATIGRDASLYGTRYPLIDEGYDASLGFYNIVNAPTFRDNQRQTAVDGHLLRQYVASGLAADLPAGTVDVSRVRRTGHSLGSVTANLGMAMAPDQYESALVTGTGGIFGLYFLETGLLEVIDPSLIEALFGLVGAPVPDEVTSAKALGAILGLDEAAWGQLDRLHPSLVLFQWQMDPSDPMAIARDLDLPITFVVAPGDLQSVDFTGEALAAAAPQGTLEHCDAPGGYDPHYCFWREPQGWELLADWLAE